MNRRTMLCAAPAVALAAAVPSTVSAAGVTSTIWAEWERADAISREAHNEMRAIEARDGKGPISDEYRRAEDRSNDLWGIAFDLGRRAYATPCRTAGDVIGKARAIAICGLEIDDFEPADAALVEALLRDLAAAHGVSAEVAAIIDPVIAVRDARKAGQAAREAAEAALAPQAAAWIEAADAAGMKPTAFLEFGGKRYLCTDLSDVDHAIVPAAPDDRLGKVIVDALIFNRRVHYFEAPPAAKGNMMVVPSAAA